MQVFFPEGPRENISPSPAVALDGPGTPHYESSFFASDLLSTFQIASSSSVPSTKRHYPSTLLSVFFFSKVLWVMPLSRDLFSPRTIWPKCFKFLLSTFASKLLLTPACSKKTHQFVFFAVHDTRKICLRLLWYWVVQLVVYDKSTTTNRSTCSPSLYYSIFSLTESMPLTSP